MKTGIKTGIGVLAGLAAGFVIGNICPIMSTGGAGKGDIAEVAGIKKPSDKAAGASRDKIKANPGELRKKAASLMILNSRMAEFDELVEVAVSNADGIPELSSSVENMKRLKLLSENAMLFGDSTIQSFDAIAEGKVPDIDYEQASQNLSLSFLLVERQTSIGRQFVSDVDSFLSGKEPDTFIELSIARDLWAAYCAGETAITDDFISGVLN